MFIAYLIFIVRRARQDRTPPRSMWTWGRSAMTGQTIFLSKCLLLVLKRHASINTRVRGFQGASGGKRFSSQPASDGVGKGEHTRIKFFFFFAARSSGPVERRYLRFLSEKNGCHPFSQQWVKCQEYLRRGRRVLTQSSDSSPSVINNLLAQPARLHIWGLRACCLFSNTTLKKTPPLYLFIYFIFFIHNNPHLMNLWQ